MGVMWALRRERERLEEAVPVGVPAASKNLNSQLCSRGLAGSWACRADQRAGKDSKLIMQRGEWGERGEREEHRVVTRLPDDLGETANKGTPRSIGRDPRGGLRHRNWLSF